MSDIYAYYQKYDESTRLTQDRLHYGEFHTVMHLLEKYLGTMPLAILDCCAGCGIYAQALTQMGHIVTAGDLIPEHITYMQANCPELHDIYEGNVCDLSRFDDASFDVVLNFGAMYHLQKQEDRDQAVRECLRVLRPGGIFAYTWQSLDAMLYSHYFAAVRSLDAQERMAHYRIIESARQTHCRDIFYGMSPEEVDALSRHHQLHTLTSANIYPALYPFFLEIEQLSDEEYQRYLSACIETCEEPLAVIHCMHGLWMGTK